MEHNWAGVELPAATQPLQKRKMSEENIYISKNTVAASLGGTLHGTAIALVSMRLFQPRIWASARRVCVVSFFYNLGI